MHKLGHPAVVKVQN